jgi:hypothetical protein
MGIEIGLIDDWLGLDTRYAFGSARLGEQLFTVVGASDLEFTNYAFFQFVLDPEGPSGGPPHASFNMDSAVNFNVIDRFGPRPMGRKRRSVQREHSVLADHQLNPVDVFQTVQH